MAVYVGMPPGYPDLATVRAYVRVPATSLPDDDLERMMTAAATTLNRCWPRLL